MLQPGDLIIFHEETEVVGLVVSRANGNLDRDLPAVLVHFSNDPLAGDDTHPLHYYEYELRDWETKGSITIHHAS